MRLDGAKFGDPAIYLDTLTLIKAPQICLTRALPVAVNFK
jgi:hypothetical protein